MDRRKEIRLHPHKLALDLGMQVGEGLVGLFDKAGHLDNPFEFPQVLEIPDTKLAMMPPAFPVEIPISSYDSGASQKLQIDYYLLLDGFPHAQYAYETGNTKRYAQKHPAVTALMPERLFERNPKQILKNQALLRPSFAALSSG